MRRSELRLMGIVGLTAGLLIAGAAMGRAQTSRRPPTTGVQGTPGKPPVGEEVTTPAPDSPQAKAERPEGGPPPGDRPQRPLNPKMIASMVAMRGPMTLLDQKPIQEELKISEEQLAKLKQGNEAISAQREQVMREAQQEMRAQMAAARANGGGGQGGGFNPGGFGPGGFGGQMQEQMGTFMAQMRSENDRMLASLLSPAQRKRFDEIVLQARGPLVVAEPWMQEILKLTPNERMKIAEILQALQVKQEKTNTARRDMFRGMFGGGPGGGRPGNPGVAPGQDRQGGARRPDGGQDQAQAQAKAGADAAPAKGEPPRRKTSGNGDEDEDGNENRRPRFQMDDETRKKMEAMEVETQDAEKEAIARIGNVLTDRHKKAYNKLLGKTFDFTLLDTQGMMPRAGGFGGGRGGFGGGRSGGGGRGGNEN